MGANDSLNRFVKRWPGWLLLGVVAAVLLAIGISGGNGVSDPGERADALAQHVACPVCDGESVYESRNRASINLRNEITSLVNEGRLERRRDPRRDPVGVPERHPPRPACRRLQRPGVGAAGGRRGLRWRPASWWRSSVGAGGARSTSPTTTTGRSCRRRWPRGIPMGDDRGASTTTVVVDPDRLATLEEERSFLLRSLPRPRCRAGGRRRRRGGLRHAA